METYTFVKDPQINLKVRGGGGIIVLCRFCLRRANFLLNFPIHFLLGISYSPGVIMHNAWLRTISPPSAYSLFLSEG